MLQFSKGKRPIIIQFSLDGNKEMHDQIRDIAKHENFYNLMNYTDHEEYELQRLDSEVKQAKKENLTNS